MSGFGRKSKEKGIRIDVLMLEAKVMIGLFLFKKIEIEKDSDETDYIFEQEMKKWCNSRGIKFSVSREERPIYFKGHEVYKSEYIKVVNLMSFSK